MSKGIVQAHRGFDMRLRSPNHRDVITLAALVGLAIGGSFAAEAGAIRQPPGATSGQLANTDFSAARKQRHSRRAPARSNADSMASQPPDRPSFGYGVGDNSRYGGG
jgi:hypothetical protein